jgi:hypothetical protein
VPTALTVPPEPALTTVVADGADVLTTVFGAGSASLMISVK